VKYPAIGDGLRKQLERIPPSTAHGCEHRPCRIRLGSGEWRDFVYVVDADAYKRLWGIWPEDDPGKESVALQDVVEIQESRHRLPAALANKLYEAGESGMGYTVFTVVLRDGRRLPYVTGNAVDFPTLPPGVTSDDIVDVLPHEGRNALKSPGPAPEETDAAYAWCLYRSA
jgi:hypothetical protein